MTAQAGPAPVSASPAGESPALRSAVDIGHDPRTGAAHPEVPHTTPEEVARLIASAAACAPQVSTTAPAVRETWLQVIAESLEWYAEELVALADAQGWGEVVLPRPGCGFGGLGWDEVGPLLVPRLDDRFLVVRWPGP